jgi:hypothetical protein
VKFFFIYKSLAHPELAGQYVQPFTLDERLAHARQAEKQLGASIPWLVDAMDNRLKHALGDRPNSEFIIDPEGLIVRKRAWSHPGQVRKDLEELVGPVARVTTEDEIHLQLQPPPKERALRGIVPRVDRSQMQAIVAQPVIEPHTRPFFAKLRAEADAQLLAQGTGDLYLGFHLDPLHEAHWNNLTQPLSLHLEIPAAVKTDLVDLQAPQVAATSDTDPREFLIGVEHWTKDEPIHLTVKYFACVGDQACYEVEQEYKLVLQRDGDGGRARGEGAGYWEREQFAVRALDRDKNGDGFLSESEAQGLIRPHFAEFDANQDGLLELEELYVVADWLNHHHQPGTPPASK